jgi:hypothetical protein
MVSILVLTKVGVDFLPCLRKVRVDLLQFAYAIVLKISHSIPLQGNFQESGKWRDLNLFG